MSTVTSLNPMATRPALVKTVMSEADYLALGETKHHEYYDGMCVVTPPSRRHAAAQVSLYEALRGHVPPDHQLLLDWGWRTGTSWFEPDLMVVAAGGPDDIAVEPPLLVVRSCRRRIASTTSSPSG